MNAVWMPKVSIVIPVYNGTNYMREAIDSALAQTYPNIEVIVVNDGSTDNGATESVALEYGDKIKYFCKENGGVSSALNYGINQMTGEYFSWLSHDDVYSPDKIQHQIESLATAEEPDAVALCAHYFIDGDSKRLSKHAPQRFENGLHFWNEVLFEMLKNGAFSGCALLLPRKVFDKLGGFNEELRFSQDYLMWMTVFLNGYKLVYNDHEDVYSRIHSKQLTQKGQALLKKDSVTIGNILIPQIADVSDKKSNYLYLYAKRNAMHGTSVVVKNSIEIAKEHKLFSFKHVIVLKLKLIYSNVRPILRKLYYKLIVRAK